MVRSMAIAAMCAVSCVLVCAQSAADDFTPPAGQEASRTEAPAIPDASASKERAEGFVEALRKNDPKLALPFFFQNVVRLTSGVAQRAVDPRHQHVVWTLDLGTAVPVSS